MHSSAGGLSRLPLKTEERAEEVVDPVNVFNMMQFKPLPITVDNVQRKTRRDPVLSQVHEMVSKGWLSSHVPVLDPCYDRRDEITVHSACLIWDIRVIVPTKDRPQVLVELHQGHPGVVKMKALTRNYI